MFAILPLVLTFCACLNVYLAVTFLFDDEDCDEAAE
jgi:hypothetical protein